MATFKNKNKGKAQKEKEEIRKEIYKELKAYGLVSDQKIQQRRKNRGKKEGKNKDKK